MDHIYLDHNATTPIAPEVAEAMKPYIDSFYGNPSSTHSFGTKTKLAVEHARKNLASLLNCDPTEIVFTSGGTESNNYALKGAAFANRSKGNHIITSSIEHPAVIEVYKYLEKQGFKATYLPVDEYGIVNPADVEDAITPSTILISIMHANNETGSIQPIQEISEIARKKNILFHSDAAQSTGKIPIDVRALGIDMLSIAGHKFYAPKGVGALYIKSGTHLEKLIHGADHEQNLRAGTENVIEIVGLGKASELAQKNLNNRSAHYKMLRDYLYELIKKELPDSKLNGHPEKRLPNTLSLSFPRIEANTLVSRLNNIAVSAGAACHSESIDLSAVLEAMGIPVEIAMGTVRFSVGNGNTKEEIEIAAKEIIKQVQSLRPEAGSTTKNEKAEGKIKLTQYTHGLGCACKIEPVQLERILASLPTPNDKNILVGTETSDDATIYRISKDQAIVQSLDFFTPIVDDPYDFGAIAAANALSDLYAMGATPLFAMNIVGFPENTLPLEVLGQILNGASDKAREAGINIIGGHTIEDPEPKYGMVVSGLIDPEKIIRNIGIRPGDALILTKPLGTGILTTAMKRNMLSPEMTRLAIETMSALNKSATEVMLNYDVHACTDVTGFGLLGHLREMTKGSKCDVEIHYDNIPFLPEAESLAGAGVIPGGTYNNLDFVKKDVDFGSLNRTKQLLLSDAQTSGGLLIAIPEKFSNSMISELKKAGINEAVNIGNGIKVGNGSITIS